MREDVKLAWIQALESGEYEQGVGQLQKNGHYCVLAVLCDLHRKMTNQGDWFSLDFYRTHGDQKVSRYYPTAEVEKWAGVPSNSQWNVVVDGENHGLHELNDNGTPFSELAKLIKENF